MKPLANVGVVRSLRNRLLGFFRRYQLSDQTFLIAVAVIVGFLGGLGSIFFEWLIEFGQHFFYGVFHFPGLKFVIPPRVFFWWS